VQLPKSPDLSRPATVRFCAGVSIRSAVLHIDALPETTSIMEKRKYWDELRRDLKPIYTAINAEAAAGALHDLRLGRRRRVTVAKHPPVGAGLVGPA
jgi:hypothetical protein